MIVRLNDYMRYPFLIVRLCRRWFPEAYLRSCLSFLNEPPERLDLGFSKEVQDIAKATGGEMDAVKWLASDPVQRFLCDVGIKVLMNSLQAEREAAEAKQWVARKVSHIATVSRDLQCARYHKQRLEKSLRLINAQQALLRAEKTTISSLAFLHGKERRPKGVPFEPRNSPATGGKRATNASPASDGGESSIKRFMLEQRGDLERERQASLAALKAALEAEKGNSCDGAPTSRVQLAAWLSENIDEFRSRMVTAPVNRRKLNYRLWARADLPPPARRLQPLAERHCLATEWAPKLAGRTGWHGIDTTNAGQRMIWLHRCLGRPWFIDLEPNRDGPALSYSLRKDLVVAVSSKQ